MIPSGYPSFFRFYSGLPPVAYQQFLLPVVIRIVTKIIMYLYLRTGRAHARVMHGTRQCALTRMYTHDRDVGCHLSAVSARKVCRLSCTLFILATSAVFLPDLLESIARLLPVLCRCPVSTCKHGNHWLAAILYHRIRPATALGQPAVKRAGGCESGQPASKRAGRL